MSTDLPSLTSAALPAISIRGLTIDPPLLLAPMAGVTHSAMRQLLLRFGGVGLLSKEMLSVRKLPTESPRVSPWIFRTESERPLSYQLLIASAAEVPRALEALHRFGADAIDLNMGCPAPTVGKFGAGISLMGQPGIVRRLVAEARNRTHLPLTAKIRIGADLDEKRLLDFCTLLQDEGIDLITVHARLKHESFHREPRWEVIRSLKARLSVPVIANGGIFSVEDAQKCLSVSGADGLMLGRGAAIKPWLFAGISREVLARPVPEPVVQLPEIYFTFIANLEQYRPQYRLGRLKEYTHYFARNFKFGHHLATGVQSSGSIEQARERAEAFFDANR